MNPDENGEGFVFAYIARTWQGDIEVETLKFVFSLFLYANLGWDAEKMANVNWRLRATRPV